jgi:hypothetical protein
LPHIVNGGVTGKRKQIRPFRVAPELFTEFPEFAFFFAHVLLAVAE